MSDEITYCDHGYSEPETGCFACCEAKLKIAVEALKGIAKLRCDCGHELDAEDALKELETAQKAVKA